MQRFKHSQFNGAAAPRGFKAGVQNFLSFGRPHRPVVVELSGKNLVRKIAEHIRFLRGRLAVAVFRNLHMAHIWNDIIAVLTDVGNFKSEFASVKRIHKIKNLKIAFRAADVDPLLAEIVERTIQARRDAGGEKQFSGKIRRHGRTGLRERASGDFAR